MDAVEQLVDEALAPIPEVVRSAAAHGMIKAVTALADGKITSQADGLSGVFAARFQPRAREWLAEEVTTAMERLGERLLEWADRFTAPPRPGVAESNEANMVCALVGESGAER